MMNEIVLHSRTPMRVARNAIPIPNKPYEARFSVEYVAFVHGKIEGAERPIRTALVRQIKIERAGAEIEEGQEDVANRATRDAIEMVVHSRLDGNPRVMQSSDGILTLEWHGANDGAALIFAGDGRAAISLRRNGGLYEDYGREVGIKDRLPSGVVDILARLS
jgi:hypothetical protein